MRELPGLEAPAGDGVGAEVVSNPQDPSVLGLKNVSQRAWAVVGEAQRICLDPPSDFAVFGDTAVMAVAEWGNAESNYVLIRDPMLVQAFIHCRPSGWS